jgi:hypothetical protein
MKRMKLIGLMLLAVFALGAFAAATASAEEGFLPTPKTATALGGTSILETASKANITCTSLDDSTITMENDKHGKATLQWLGCKAEGLFGANSLGDKAEVILAEVLFLVCLDPTNAAGTLIDNFGVIGEVVGKLHLEVPAVGALTIVTGAALGAILTTGPAKLWIMEFNRVGTGSPGAQVVTDCKQGTTTILHNLLSELNENKKPEAASENVASGLLQFPSEVELMDS